MPIEFRCTQCHNLLRVPDESAGAQARCPKCSAIITVPASGSAGGPEPSDNPFAELGQRPADQSAGNESVNPYSSPASGYDQPHVTGAMGHEMVATPVDAGSVINYAWEVWKANLGLLVGVTVVVFVISIGFGAVQGFVETIFAHQGNEEVGVLIGFVLSVCGNLVQMFLEIGKALIVLKLLRGEPAEFSELFNGGSVFLSVLGASILAGIAIVVGFLACIVPGILLLLFFWPFYWLIIDRKAGAIESFGMAYQFGKANAGTTFVLWLASFGIMLLGVLACLVGILFAAPLVSVIWGAAYLMMSGQLRTGPRY